MFKLLYKFQKINKKKPMRDLLFTNKLFITIKLEQSVIVPKAYVSLNIN